MVKVLEVFIREGGWISGDMHSRTNKVKIKIHTYFSLTVNIVTKKTKKMGVRLFFCSATRMLWGESICQTQRLRESPSGQGYFSIDDTDFPR